MGRRHARAQRQAGDRASRAGRRTDGAPRRANHSPHHYAYAGDCRGRRHLGIMIYVLTPEAARDADAQGIAQAGEDALMRTAGTRIAERLRAMAGPQRPIVAFAGPGNNGGDAFAALAE